MQLGRLDRDPAFGIMQVENGNGSLDTPGEASSVDENGMVSKHDSVVQLMSGPFGLPCIVEIFHFLCSLLNISEHIEMGPRSNPVTYEEDMPLFALGLINSAIELAGPSIRIHLQLLSLVKDELFYNLMQLGLSTSPLIISMVCNIVLNLYHHLHSELKLQIEAFFSCVILRLAKNRHGASYQQQEVAMEALVDFCRQKNFMAEMYANLDCEITCDNTFEELVNLLSQSAFPVNSPLSAMHILALDGLIAIVKGMVSRINKSPQILDEVPFKLERYTPFWTAKCDNYSDPNHWVQYIRHRKYIKKKLMAGVDHFNREPNKGLEFLQGIHLLPEKLDPHSVACFFHYTSGLDKNYVGEFLGNHDEFCIRVLHEFAKIFDFQDMNLDTALRLFLDTFRLPGESQKIQRVLEAFSERYYEQSPHILANKDAALLLSYSLIMLNTDQHNVQVKKKMTKEDFIRNNRHINGGNDLPREYLSELYHAICKNELKTIPEQGAGFPEMTPSHWIDIMQKSKKTSPYIFCNSLPFLDQDMFAIMCGPTIAAISVVFDYAEHDEVFHSCIEGFLVLAKLSASYHLGDVLDDLVTSLCRFTTLTNSSSVDEPAMEFGDDLKARLATEAVFNLANQYGDFIRTGWRGILDCILRLNKLGFLPARVASDATSDEYDTSADTEHGKLNSQITSQAPIIVNLRKPSGLMGRFSQLLSLDTEEPRSQPTEQQIAAHNCTIQTIQKCHIDSIFTESKFLQADSLLNLVHALISAAAQIQKDNGLLDDEDIAVFCLELLIAITLNNRDRIVILWQSVYDHIASIVQSTSMPSPLVEKAVFGLLKICQRLLPYKENLADELMRSLQLILKLDARVADAYCENITHEVTRLVKTNATHIKSPVGWRTITSLLSITARHPEASECGFEALLFIMSDGAHLSPANYILCIEAARQFAQSRVGLAVRSVRALDLMAESVRCLVRWSLDTKDAKEGAEKISQGLQEMWLRLVHGLKKVCLDQRDEVRNHALSLLQRCMVGVEDIRLSPESWLQCFDTVIFTLLDELLDIVQGQSRNEYRNMETSLVLAMKLLSKVFLQSLEDLAPLSSFIELWASFLSQMEKYIKVKIRSRRSEKLQELIPELLKNTLLVMKAGRILNNKAPISAADNLWELTWVHVNDIVPSLKTEVLSIEELAQDAAAIVVDKDAKEAKKRTESGHALSLDEGIQAA